MATTKRPTKESLEAAKRRFFADPKNKLPPAELPPDRGRRALRRELDPNSARDAIELERVRERSRKRTRVRRPPKGLTVYRVVDVVNQIDGRSVPGSRQAEPGELPDWIFVGGPGTEVPAPMSPADHAVVTHVFDHLKSWHSTWEAVGSDPPYAEPSTVARWRRAYEAIFGHAYEDAWRQVVLDVLIEVAKARHRLLLHARRPQMSKSQLSARELAAMEREASERGLFERIQDRLERFPGVLLPAHLDQATLGKIAGRFGVHGGGGTSKKLSLTTVRGALGDAKKTATMLRMGSTPRPKRR